MKNGARMSVKQKDNEPQWKMAEDAFLKLFCRIERFEWGAFYFWDAGQDWPKFNFIRLLESEVATSDFHGLVDKYQPYFIQRKRTFNVRIPDRLLVSPEITKCLKPAGTPLVSLRFDPKKLASPSSILDVGICKNLEEVALWWDINSDGRSRQEQGKSPLWPVIVDAFHSGTQYFILRIDGQPVAGGALTSFNDGKDYNLWGLATRQAHQRRGYIKTLVAAVGHTIGVPYYLQVNLESVSHQMFRKLGAEQLMIERRFELA